MIKDRKSNRLHPSIGRREPLVNSLLGVVQDEMERSLGLAERPSGGKRSVVG